MIPCRYGSVRAKLKNLASVGNRPMMAWAINAAIESNSFDKVIVNGDHDVFEDVSEAYNVEFYKRPESLGSSKTLIDDVLYDFVINNSCDTAAIVNTVNPLQSGADVASVVNYYEKNNLDSCNTFIYKYNHAYFKDQPLNFKQGKLVKTQDLVPIKLLTGNVQIVRVPVFKNERNIFCGKFGMYGPMSNKASITVKYDEDIKIVDAIKKVENEP